MKDRLFRLLGIDRAIYFVVLGRMWLTLASVVNLLAIGFWLSPEEQGYYYTFASVLAAQIFFELGLTTVVMQFASHESVWLTKDASGRLHGDGPAKARLASLVRLSLRWYGVLTLLFIIFIGPIGWFFFSSNSGGADHVSWKSAWTSLVVTNAGILWLSPVFAILEGCGMVAEVARFRLFQSLGAHLALWIFLWAGLGVHSAVVFSLVAFVAGLVWIWKRHGRWLRDFLHEARSGAAISWRREIFPYQWRIAVSYSSGYFIMQLFNPVLFTYHGAAEAGRMGMSVAMTGAVSTLSLAWITTKAPAFGGLVAQRKFGELDDLFSAAFKRTLAISASAALALIFGIWVLNRIHHPMATRFLPPPAFAPLVLSSFASTVITAMAIYLRAFKREPFLLLSVAVALLVALLTYFLGRIYGSFAITMGYFLVNVSVGLGLGWLIFTRKRRKWVTMAT